MSLLDTASLIVTPNGYKEGKLYSVIPSDGSGDMSVVRATTATRVNSAGLVELVPYNLLQYSQQFTNAIWTPRNGTFTDNFATAPDGTLTASRWVATDADPYVYQGFTGNGGNYVASVYVKGVGSSIGKTASIRVSGTLSNFTITGEWQRVQISTTISTSVIIGCEVPDPAVIGDTIYIWGFQLVEGSTAKDYQKTETRLNIPRLDYSNGTCPSLLVEPQRTNLQTYSEALTPNFTFNQCSITSNQIGPNGLNSAKRITNGATANDVYFEQSVGIAVNTYTWSAYVKQGTDASATIKPVHVGIGGDVSFMDFNFASETIITSGAITSSGFTALANGWYRIYCSVPITLAVISLRGRFGNSNTPNVYNEWFGVQLEQGSYPTSYIPTTSASVTRNADVISKTGISSLIGQTEGTFFTEFYYNGIIDNSNARKIISLNDGSSTNLIDAFIGVTGNTITTRVRANNSSLGQINSAVLTQGFYKIAYAYKNSDFVLYVNGVQAGSVSSGTISFTSAVSIAQIGDGEDSNDQLGSLIKATALWKTRLTNDQLATLTTL
jgi:hypothetical protein